jgi:hypothetical protein
MVRWCLVSINSSFFSCAFARRYLLYSLRNMQNLTLDQLAYAANAISLQGNCCLCACRSTQLYESSHEKRLRLCAGHPEFSLEFLRAMGTLRQQMYARARHHQHSCMLTAVCKQLRRDGFHFWHDVDGRGVNL